MAQLNSVLDTLEENIKASRSVFASSADKVSREQINPCKFYLECALSNISKARNVFLNPLVDEKSNVWIKTELCEEQVEVKPYEQLEQPSSSVSLSPIASCGTSDDCTQADQQGASLLFETNDVKDYTKECALLLEAISATGSFGQYGLGIPISLLRGSKQQRIPQQLKESSLSGAGKFRIYKWWKTFARYLIDENYLTECDLHTVYGKTLITVALSSKGNEWRDSYNDGRASFKIVPTQELLVFEAVQDVTKTKQRSACKEPTKYKISGSSTVSTLKKSVDQGPAETEDRSKECALLLEAVKITGSRFGLRLPILLLRGSKSKKIPEDVRDSHLAGAGSIWPETWWITFGKYLIDENFLTEVATFCGNSIYGLTSKGKEWLDSYNRGSDFVNIVPKKEPSVAADPVVPTSTQPTKMEDTDDIPLAQRSRKQRITYDPVVPTSTQPTKMEDTDDIPLAQRSRKQRITYDPVVPTSTQPTKMEDTDDLLAQRSWKRRITYDPVIPTCTQPSKMEDTDDIPLSGRSWDQSQTSSSHLKRQFNYCLINTEHPIVNKMKKYAYFED